MSVGLSFDLIDFEMGLASDKHSDSLGEGSFELLVKLVDTDSVHEVSDVIISVLAPEDNGDIQGNENVVISRASSHWELVDDILLGHQELNLSPWEAEYKPTLFLHVIELSVLCDDCVRSFGSNYVI